MAVKILRWLFFALLVRPLVRVGFGLNVRHRERLPTRGPAVVVANHNSHLDTLVMLSLFPLGVLDKLRPVAAMDYFLRNRALAWFSLRIIGIIGIDRDARRKGLDPLLEPGEALERGEILILYPEGSRGEPEQMAPFKKGVSYLSERYPQVPVIPCFLHGPGKSLPRGAVVPVPMHLDVFIGEPVSWSGDRDAYMRELRGALERLAGEADFPRWT